MKLNVGIIRSNCGGFDTIAEIAVRTKDVRLDSVEFDLSFCSFFEANMAAPLYAVIARLRDELNDVTITNVPAGVSNILRKNKFLSVFNQPELTDTNQTTLPFKILKLTAGDQFNDYLDTYMRGRGIPTMSEALTKRFRQSLSKYFSMRPSIRNRNPEFLSAGNFTQINIDWTLPLLMLESGFGKTFEDILGNQNSIPVRPLNGL